MQHPESRQQQSYILTKLRDVSQRYEAFIEKSRAQRAADNLAATLRQKLQPRKASHSETTVYTAHLVLSGDRRVAVELFHTKGAKGNATKRQARPYDRINYWEKGMGPGLTRAIEFRPNGLYIYQAQGLSEKDPLTVKPFVRATFLQAIPAELRALHNGSWVPFDATLQSQVYCEIANLFTEAQKNIEMSGSPRQAK